MPMLPSRPPLRSSPQSVRLGPLQPVPLRLANCQDGGPPLSDRRPRASLLTMGHHHPPGRSAAADGTGPLIGSVAIVNHIDDLHSETALAGQGAGDVLGPADDYEAVAIEVAEVKHGWHATSEPQDL